MNREIKRYKILKAALVLTESLKKALSSMMMIMIHLVKRLTMAGQMMTRMIHLLKRLTMTEQMTTRMIYLEKIT